MKAYTAARFVLLYYIQKDPDGGISIILQHYLNST